MQFTLNFVKLFIEFKPFSMIRKEIAKEFTDSKGEVDDMMAGLHEIRVRKAEKNII